MTKRIETTINITGIREAIAQINDEGTPMHELAKSIGFSEASLYRFQRGDRDKITHKMIHTIICHLGFDVIKDLFIDVVDVTYKLIPEYDMTYLYIETGDGCVTEVGGFFTLDIGNKHLLNSHVSLTRAVNNPSSVRFEVMSGRVNISRLYNDKHISSSHAEYLAKVHIANVIRKNKEKTK